jgi:hypothetical protein
MLLAEGTDRAGLEQALAAFSAVRAGGMGRCGAHVIGGGFLARPIEQPGGLTDFAAERSGVRGFPGAARAESRATASRAADTA